MKLSQISTIRVGGRCDNYYIASSLAELEQIIIAGKAQDKEIKVIGGGSNTFFSDEVIRSLLVRINISGWQIIDSDKDSVIINVHAGTLLESLVKETIELGLSGLEYLAGIPGTVGATPVQNVSAYGQAIADLMIGLRAYDIYEEKLVYFSAEECLFTYRKSRFNDQDAGRYIILQNWAMTKPISIVHCHHDP